MMFKTIKPYANKIVGTPAVGEIMPPAGLLPEDEVQIIIDWIESGALPRLPEGG